MKMLIKLWIFKQVLSSLGNTGIWSSVQWSQMAPALGKIVNALYDSIKGK